VVNRYGPLMPLVNRLSLVQWMVARPSPARGTMPGRRVSVIIPCKNERGNIDAAVERLPVLGDGTEIVFVDGNSDDGTVEAIDATIAAHPEREIRLIHQGDGKGKGDAVRKGFEAATGDILMILDADLTVAPEDLPKFCSAIIAGKGDLINGTRLVYPMEQQAMRFLNFIANKLFGVLFSWLLGQRITDTLCGTKVLYRRDYERIKANRSHFGNFDPFGDFDLLFGAARLNMKLIDLPVRYHDRTYGDTKISRFRHGLLLFRMCGIALKRLKLMQ
jgi:glycosyltransferase involved in cell wall biosynthesis